MAYFVELNEEISVGSFCPVRALSGVKEDCNDHSAGIPVRRIDLSKSPVGIYWLLMTCVYNMEQDWVNTNRIVLGDYCRLAHC